MNILPKKAKDLTGMKFGRLTVLKFFGSVNGRIKWECECECGTITTVGAYSLTSGSTTSCGCFNREQSSKKHSIDLSGRKFGKLLVLKRITDIGDGNIQYLCQCDCGSPPRPVFSSGLISGRIQSCGCKERDPKSYAITHGLSHTPEYRAYKQMKSRCYNPNNISYENYGGRGITVCDRWLEPDGQGFKNFLEDIGPKPFNGAMLERINNNLGYFPENCIWATRKDQNRNRRSCVIKDIHEANYIRSLYFNRKLKCYEIASMFDVRYLVIYDIIKNITWV
jgi:hypothetical protein